MEAAAKGGSHTHTHTHTHTHQEVFPTPVPSIWVYDAEHVGRMRGWWCMLRKRRWGLTRRVYFAETGQHTHTHSLTHSLTNTHIHMHMHRGRQCLDERACVRVSLCASEREEKGGCVLRSRWCINSGGHVRAYCGGEGGGYIAELSPSGYHSQLLSHKQTLCLFSHPLFCSLR